MSTSYARNMCDRGSPTAHAQAQETITTPSQFISCWSGVEDESRIESLVSDLSDVDSLTIMSPKSDDSRVLAPGHIATDSVLLNNQVYDEEEGPLTGESMDSGMVSRHLKPIRTRSSMGGSVTPACSTPEVSPPYDRLAAGTNVPGRRKRSSRKGRLSSPLRGDRGGGRAMRAFLSSAKPSRSSRPVSTSASPDHAMSSPGSFKPEWHEAGHHSQKGSFDQGSMEHFLAQPGTPGVRPGTSSMDVDSPKHKLSVRSMHALDQELEQEPSIEEQTQMLYACIQAMEAQLQRQEEESARELAKLSVTSQSLKGPSTTDMSPRDGVLTSAQEPQPVAYTGNNGATAYGTGPQPPWQGQQQCQPQMFPQYPMPMGYGFQNGANGDNSQVPNAPSNKKLGAAHRSSSNHTRGSKRSSKSSKKHAAPKSYRSGKTSVASAKGEGVRHESSGEIIVGPGGTSTGEGQGQAQKDQTGKLSVSKAKGTLNKGQTAEVTKALNEVEQEEQVSGGCLGQFWGANRKVKKKKDMPRAPKITAPVIESQKGDRLGVRLGCL